MAGQIDRVTSANVDLNNCDRELIQFSNAIQPHAVLLVIDPQSFDILQASANSEELGVKAGRPLEALLGEAQTEELRKAAARLPAAGGPLHLMRASFPSGARNVFGHNAAGGLILELERDGHCAMPESALYRQLHGGIASLHATSSLLEFLDRACQVIKDTSGFERVMAYRFMEDGSGQVVAESVNEGLERFLGLHYPASDIPQPARRLFSLTWLRFLPDVNYRPVPIVPEVNPITHDAIDLSYAFSRSVSVMYTDYLRNMDVQATMVLTLMKNGKLWGLVSCMSHRQPHHISHEARGACELLGHLVSLLMTAKEDLELSGYKQRLSDALAAYKTALARSGTLSEALLDGPVSLLAAIDASGAAIIENGRARTIGETPPAEFINSIALQIAGRIDTVWSTDKLSAASDSARKAIPVASGLLALRVGRKSSDFVFWFRPEYLRTVSWAGDPSKPVEMGEKDGVPRLMPRGSFAAWKAEVRGRSKSWKECELAFAAGLGRGIVEVIVDRSREIADLNTELARSNRELDDFVYAASHDLKEPLRGIHSYAQFLQRTAAGKLDAVENGRLEAIGRLARRVDSLIEGLLDYSRAGHGEMSVEAVDLNEVLVHVLAMLQPRLEETGTNIRIPRKLPRVPCDPLQLQQVYMNLLTNAIKYNDKPDPWIEIGWREDGPSFFVRDNGIGIAEEHWDSIFKIFRRLHRRDDFGGGTGAGLTIVKRTVERHGGRMWLESSVGEGSTFYFTLSGENIQQGKKMTS